MTKSYTYLGHIITDNLCGEADIKAKVGCLYRPVASNARLVRPRSCGTMLIIYAKINPSESAGF